MKKGNIWVHVGAWAGLYIFWLLLFQNRALAFSRTMTIEFCYLLFITADYYAIVYFIIPAYLKQKKYCFLYSNYGRLNCTFGMA